MAPEAPGLIPAHAGKTRFPLVSHDSSPAHPRSRGENKGLLAEAFARAGSSPLTRGKPSRRWWGLGVRRLIPAHAGKTHGALSLCQLEAAHPRSRGENAHRLGGTEYPEGSSPLTRVKLLNGQAGDRAVVAHPRSRGENCLGVLDVCEEAGSSPLTRGKLRVGVGEDGLVRLIPAHAGKTPW